MDVVGHSWTTARLSSSVSAVGYPGVYDCAELPISWSLMMISLHPSYGMPVVRTDVNLRDCPCQGAVSDGWTRSFSTCKANQLVLEITDYL